MFWFLTMTVAAIFIESKREAFAVISPVVSLNAIASHLMPPQERWMNEVPVGTANVSLWVAILCVGAYAALFTWIIRRNLKIVEVVK